MPSLALQAKAELQNVTDLVPSNGVDAALLLGLECNSCHEKHPNAVALDPSNVDELQRSRGEANLIVNCPSCRRENSATYVVRKPGSKGDLKLGEIAPWTALTADGAGNWQTLCTVDFRGMTPLAPEIDTLLPDGATWSCTGTESSTPFTDVQFEDGEWHDYDEKAGVEVGVVDVQFRWQKV
ncbi:hypothetical protein GLX27_002761 [Malassezia furfur]|uniref:Uncharacterized protein n=1 Tax=Malassezia furfur TaxID=55194 RepID=A0ABY8EUZ5_MALFU|nr:hypothetical protein CBS14141_002432 [Malassezia furfur]WFD48093.1 hypothetical protein GLX27_002761 [Malassezia furfur]